MPPRVPGAAGSLAALDTTAARLRSSRTSTAVRCFSTTPTCEASRRRIGMKQWLEGQGRKVFSSTDSEPGPQYAGPDKNQPFPLNPHFRSEPVLSEELRELIWQKVIQKGEAMKAVSQEFHIDVRRVGAVVRLMEVEKRMRENKEQLAVPYAKAILGMLPQTRVDENGQPKQAHEPINEIPVHKLSKTQLFVPVSESRHFTREDAAKAFHAKLLSADERSFHQELIRAEKALASGMDHGEALQKFRQDVQQSEEDFAAKMAEKKRREAERTHLFKTDRAAFRIKDIKVEDGGKHGRSSRGVGWRYGAPLQDRKRGVSKIPTSVP